MIAGPWLGVQPRRSHYGPLWQGFSNIGSTRRFIFVPGSVNLSYGPGNASLLKDALERF